MDKWAELRKAVEELSGETGKLLSNHLTDNGWAYSFHAALQWVLNRMSYLDQKEKDA